MTQIQPIPALRPAAESTPATEPITHSGAGGSFSAMLDEATTALRAADRASGALALGTGNVAEASIARAKADVELEVAAITASRVSNAVSTLLQTQV